jgi:hypothetical protein
MIKSLSNSFGTTTCCMCGLCGKLIATSLQKSLRCGGPLSLLGISEFFFGDKVREGLTLVGVFLEGTTVTH